MQDITTEISELQALLIQCIPMLIFAFLALVAPAILRRVFKFFHPRLRPHAPEWLEILFDSYKQPLLLMTRCFFIGLMFFSAPFGFNNTTYQHYVVLGVRIAFLFLIGWGAWRASPLCTRLLRSAENKLDFTTGKTMSAFFENIYRALVILLFGTMVLDCLGVPVTALLTGAGVAGLAVSLAAQSTLSNLIAGITLVLERPFGIGDYVVLGSYEGSVEDVSFRSTRIRTPDNSLITVENSKVCAEYIQNVTNRTSRLWECTIGVTYDTPPEKIESLCAAATELLTKNSSIVPGSVSVTLSAFGASSIDVLARAYVTKLSLKDFLQFKNDLNLQIMDLMQQQGCDFAFPSTTVYLAGGKADAPAKN